jgi:transposase-like protein
MLVELSVMEQRYHAVMEVVSGAPVTEVARRYGVSRQAVYGWLGRYESEGLAGLAGPRPRPPQPLTGRVCLPPRLWHPTAPPGLGAVRLLARRQRRRAAVRPAAIMNPPGSPASRGYAGPCQALRRTIRGLPQAGARVVAAPATPNAMTSRHRGFYPPVEAVPHSYWERLTVSANFDNPEPSVLTVQSEAGGLTPPNRKGKRFRPAWPVSLLRRSFLLSGDQTGVRKSAPLIGVVTRLSPVPSG